MTENKGDLISRETLKKAIEQGEGFSWDSYGKDDLCVRKKYIDNAPTVEVPENAVNCVLTMFGKCSYNETGCSDCEIKDKIRKALSERPQGEWIHYLGCGIGKAVCSECGQLGETKKYCGNCGAKMGGGYS